MSSRSTTADWLAIGFVMVGGLFMTIGAGLVWGGGGCLFAFGLWMVLVVIDQGVNS